MKLVVFGSPRTKKNHSRLVRAGRRLRLVPSAAHETWARSAIPQLRAQWQQPPLIGRVAVRALFYRERNVGDLVNFMQALADALEAAAVVENDRLIVSSYEVCQVFLARSSCRPLPPSDWLAGSHQRAVCK